MGEPDRGVSSAVIASALKALQLLHRDRWLAPEKVAATDGDADEDGTVDSTDIQLIEQHLTGQSPLSGTAHQNADVNRNGAIDVGDLVTVSRMAQDLSVVVPSVVNEGRQRAENLLVQAGLGVGSVSSVQSGSMES